jgi:3-oxoacyl-[acyl-carrier protein] reductase
MQHTHSGKADLTGKTALVTGASSGIGLQIASQFAEHGGFVYLADIDFSKAQERAQEIGSGAAALRMDIGDAAQVGAALDQILVQKGEIDILVNNAGVLAQGPFDRISRAEWDKLIAVNLTGVFNCIQAVVPAMIRRGHGNIINIASVSAFKGGGTMGNVWYGATKAAVVAMTKGLSRELGPQGIRVNAIAPSVVETNMLKDSLTAEVKQQIVAQFPLGRLATKMDVADLAVFLASELSSFITGQIIAVDGGYLNV